jgi:hypothetical protein
MSRLLEPRFILSIVSRRYVPVSPAAFKSWGWRCFRSMRRSAAYSHVHRDMAGSKISLLKCSIDSDFDLTVPDNMKQPSLTLPKDNMPAAHQHRHPGYPHASMASDPRLNLIAVHANGHLRGYQHPALAPRRNGSPGTALQRTKHHRLTNGVIRPDAVARWRV